MSEKSKSSKSRAVESLKPHKKPGNKEEMSSRTRSKDLRPTTNSKNKKSSGTSKSLEKYCSKTGEGRSRRASTSSDEHRPRSRSRSRSPLLRTSSDDRCDPRVSLGDSASRADEHLSTCSGGESMCHSSGLG